MKTLILTILAMIFLVNSISAHQTNKWIGIYTFDEESKDTDGKWSSRWFRLEVKEIDGKLFGIYSDGENGTTFEHFSLTVVTDKDTATFYFKTELKNIDVACSEESRFQKGDLMFELKNSFDKNNKPILQTIWGKENFGARSETGGIRNGKNVFFVSVPGYGAWLQGDVAKYRKKLWKAVQ